jgi:monoamine oxidase
VLIIGGGVAGLAAAGVLARTCEVTLLEARDRLGGRIETRLDPALPHPRELGAEFVHGRPRALERVLKRARIGLERVPDVHLVLDGARLRPMGREWSRTLAKIAQADRDEPFSSWAEREVPACDRPFARAYVEGYYAADAERVSAQAVGELERASEALQADALVRRPRGGYGALVAAMRARLEDVELRLSTVVEELRWSRGVTVRARDALGNALELSADAAVIALPLGVLKARPPAPGAVRFVPELAKRPAIDALEDGPIVKAVLRFRRPVWLESPRASRHKLRQAAFAHAWGAPFPTLWKALPDEVPWLTAWAAGAPARRWVGRDPDALLDAALDSVATAYGLDRALLADALDGAEVHDWGSDPFTRGGYAYTPVGALDAAAALARSEGPLFFAGEATHTEGQGGTVHGAIETGERAARALLG